MSRRDSQNAPRPALDRKVTTSLLLVTLPGHMVILRARINDSHAPGSHSGHRVLGRGELGPAPAAAREPQGVYTTEAGLFWERGSFLASHFRAPGQSLPALGPRASGATGGASELRLWRRPTSHLWTCAYLTQCGSGSPCFQATRPIQNKGGTAAFLDTTDMSRSRFWGRPGPSEAR